MKNHLTGKKLLKSVGLFSILFLLLNGIPHLAFSQDFPAPPAKKLTFPAPDYPEPSIRVKSVEHNNQTAPFSNQAFPPDFVTPQDKIRNNQEPIDTTRIKKIKKSSATPPQKLSPNQNKKNVEPDKILGTDMQGRQLYKDSAGNIYYMDHGFKMIVK